MRECGDCIACCVYLKVKELDLKGMEHCPHLNLDHDPIEGEAQYTCKEGCQGCSIYDDPKKPSICNEYQCLWVQGFGLEEDRPDKSLILADTIHEVKGAIECKQLAPDIINTPEGLATVTRLARETDRCAMVPKFYEKTWDRIVGRAP